MRSGYAHRLFILVSVIAVTTVHVLAADGDQSASADGGFDCYSCLGRDYDNCMFGKTRCAGACWKLVDQKHEIIAKGCTAEAKNDNTQEADVDMKVRLPWSGEKEEMLRGTTYYCKGDLCNSAPTLSQMPLALCLSIILGTIAGQFLTQL